MSFPCLIKQQSFQYAPRALKGPVMEAQSSPGDHKMKNSTKSARLLARHNEALVSFRVFWTFTIFMRQKFSPITLFMKNIYSD